MGDIMSLCHSTWMTDFALFVSDKTQIDNMRLRRFGSALLQNQPPHLLLHLGGRAFMLTPLISMHCKYRIEVEYRDSGCCMSLSLTGLPFIMI